MKVLLVVAHPEPKSFNGAMASTIADTLKTNGHEVQVSDLYAMKFDPSSDRRNFKSVADAGYYKQQSEELYASQNGTFADDLEAEISKLEWCDTLIFQFPLWWFGLPAVLKGWADRVFVMGRIYGLGQIFEKGKFRGKRAMCSLTTGGGSEIYTKQSPTGDILEVLKPINVGIFYFLGFEVAPPFVVYQPARISEQERKEKLDELAKHVKQLETIKPILSHETASATK